jgi:hypothetical protein
MKINDSLLYESESGKMARERELFFDFGMQIKRRTSTDLPESHYKFRKIILFPLIYLGLQYELIVSEMTESSDNILV